MEPAAWPLIRCCRWMDTWGEKLVMAVMSVMEVMAGMERLELAMDV